MYGIAKEPNTHISMIIKLKVMVGYNERIQLEWFN